MTMMFLLQEAQALFRAPGEVGVEQTIANLVQWLKLALELTGAAIIGSGLIASIFRFLSAWRSPGFEGYNDIRLTFSRFLALALEFQLGADILSTAIAPSWDQIGKLGAIALIRTALNYFLTREMREERTGETIDSRPAAGAAAEISKL